MITMMALGFLLPAAFCLISGSLVWELLFLAVAAARPFRFLVDNFFVLGFVFFVLFFVLFVVAFAFCVGFSLGFCFVMCAFHFI